VYKFKIENLLIRIIDTPGKHFVAKSLLQGQNLMEVATIVLIPSPNRKLQAKEKKLYLFIESEQAMSFRKEREIEALSLNRLTC